MTISSGSQILADDVNNADNQTLANLKADNNIKPTVFWFNIQFNNIKLESTIGEKTRVFISPDNFLLDEIRIQTVNVSSPLTCSFDSAFMLRPVQISSSGDASRVSLSPYLELTGSTPYQPILRGNEYTITFNTSMTGASRNSATVSLGFRANRRRE